MIADKFRIIHHDSNIEIPAGESIIGRGSECYLILNDPSISRRHASLILDDTGLSIADLGSRNGIQINGIQAAGRVQVHHDDEITIGHQRLRVLNVDEHQDFDRNTTDVMICHRCQQYYASDLDDCPHCAKRTQTQPAVHIESESKRPNSGTQPKPQARRGALFDSVIDPKPIQTMAGLAIKAAQVGKLEDGASFLKNLLSLSISRLKAESSALDEKELQLISNALTYFTEASKNTDHLSNLFQIYRLSGILMPRELVEKLYDLVLKVNYQACKELKSYIEVVSAKDSKYSPGEKFILRRLQGLVAICNR